METGLNKSMYNNKKKEIECMRAEKKKIKKILNSHNNA